MTRAVIYSRYSAGPDQTDQSIEGQLRVCKKYIEDRGWVLVHTYEDKHITGRSDKRPGFQKMIKDAEAGRFDALVVYSSDRFSRSKYDSVVYKKRLKDAGVKICYAAENIPDGPEGVLLESLMEGWAQYYSEELSRKVKRGMLESAQKGKTTGPKPYGYVTGPDKEWVIDEERARVVKLIYKDFLAGSTRAEILHKINGLGYRTVKGRPFGHTAITSILSNPVYTGDYEWHGVKIPGVPAIISDDDFAAAQVKLAHPAKKPKGDFKLTGLLFCGTCGSHFRGTSGTGKSGARHYYYKPTCLHWKNIPRDDLESFIFTEVKKVLEEPVELEKLANRIISYRDYKNSTREEYKLLVSTYNKLDREADAIVDAVAQRRASDKLLDRLDEIEAILPDLKVKIEKTYVPDITDEEIKNGLRLFLKSQEHVLSTLINKVLIWPDRIQIYFNLFEDDRVKAADLIKFDQTSEWWALGAPGRTLEATPWGLRIILKSSGFKCYTKNVGISTF